MCEEIFAHTVVEVKKEKKIPSRFAFQHGRRWAIRASSRLYHLTSYPALLMLNKAGCLAYRGRAGGERESGREGVVKRIGLCVGGGGAGNREKGPQVFSFHRVVWIHHISLDVFHLSKFFNPSDR